MIYNEISAFSKETLKFLSKELPVLSDIGSMGHNTEHERRRHPRYEFAYPVEFKLFSLQPQPAPINGFLENISLQGACIQFRDKYGRINTEDLTESRVKVSILMPEGENISILSSVRWKGGDSSESFSVFLGMEFDDVNESQRQYITSLIDMKNKDMNMIWGLWDQFNRLS